jgi:6-phosphogluconolactonase
MTSPTVVVHPDADVLAQAVSARLVTALIDVQAAGRVPSWVLTGGTIADRVHRAVAASPARDAVDWSRVELWWGDERFLPSGDDERNETQARAALLDQVPLSAARVHPMPAASKIADDPHAAAASYADELAAAAAREGDGGVPAFDVLMLGVGPDGHVASLFPGLPSLYDERPVAAVLAAPKPPPTRLTLTLSTLGHAREVWFIAAGQEKARAVKLAMSGVDVEQVPAAGPRGLDRTLWLLDRDAASAAGGQ